MAYPKDLPPALTDFLSQYGADNYIFPVGCRDHLKGLARTINTSGLSEKGVEYGVLTMNPEDWEKGKNCNNIYPPYLEKSWSFLNYLAAWAHSNAGEKWAFILLIDGQEVFDHLRDPDARMNLTWLRNNGPRNRVFVIFAR